jgi:hypothetical protein
MQVNGVEVTGRTLESVFAMVKGDEGTTVNLELYSHSQVRAAFTHMLTYADVCYADVC